MKKRKFDPNDFEFSVDHEGEEFVKSWLELLKSDEFKDFLKEVGIEEKDLLQEDNNVI